jgi:hypothetical protein
MVVSPELSRKRAAAGRIGAAVHAVCPLTRRCNCETIHTRYTRRAESACFCI